MQITSTVHPRFSSPRLTGPLTNRPGSTGRYIQLFILKSTRFTVEKKQKANKETQFREFIAERRESTIKQTSILSFFSNSIDES